MISKKSVIYRFLCIWWVLINMAPRNSTDPTQETCATADHADHTASTRQHELDHADQESYLS